MTPDEFELWKYNGCTRKIPYTTLDKAARAARRRRQATGLSIHAYQCDFSGEGKPHYHIGRKKKTAAQKSIQNTPPGAPDPVTLGDIG